MSILKPSIPPLHYALGCLCTRVKKERKGREVSPRERRGREGGVSPCLAYATSTTVPTRDIARRYTDPALWWIAARGPMSFARHDTPAWTPTEGACCLPRL